MKHEIHYESYFIWEDPIHRTLLQPLESPCRGLYPLWWFVFIDETSNKPIHPLGSASPLYDGLHIVFVDFGKPTSYLSKPSKFIDFLQSNT